MSELAGLSFVPVGPKREPLGRADGNVARDEKGAGPLDGRTDLVGNVVGMCSVPILRQGRRHTLVVRAALQSTAISPT
jgi:hypothetical protein